MEKTDPLERPSSETPSLHSQCKFKSPQIRALQTVLRDEEKENWHLLFAHSPSRSIEKIQPNKPSPALNLGGIYWEKTPPKLIWYWQWQHHFWARQHSPGCLPPGAVGQSQLCKSQQGQPVGRVRVPQGLSRSPQGRASPSEAQQVPPRQSRSPRAQQIPQGRSCPGWAEPRAHLAVVALHVVVLVHRHHPDGLLGALGGAETKWQWCPRRVFSVFTQCPAGCFGELFSPRESPLSPCRVLWPLKVLTLGHGTAPLLSCLAPVWVSGTSKLQRSFGKCSQNFILKEQISLEISNLPKAPRIWTNYQSKTCSLGNYSLYTSCSDFQDLHSSQTMHMSLCVPMGTDIPVWQVIMCTGF